MAALKERDSGTYTLVERYGIGCPELASSSLHALSPAPPSPSLPSLPLPPSLSPHPPFSPSPYMMSVPYLYS